MNERLIEITNLERKIAKVTQVVAGLLALGVALEFATQGGSAVISVVLVGFLIVAFGFSVGFQKGSIISRYGLGAFLAVGGVWCFVQAGRLAMENSRGTPILELVTIVEVFLYVILGMIVVYLGAKMVVRTR